MGFSLDLNCVNRMLGPGITKVLLLDDRREALPGMVIHGIGMVMKPW